MSPFTVTSLDSRHCNAYHIVRKKKPQQIRVFGNKKNCLEV